ncbi:glutamate decarboxylase [Vibrio ponticus]|nr:glutamate decarboxylase [Vibrio ponticus]
MRQMPMAENHYCLTAEDMLSMVDENTIMVVPTFGQTFTGLYEQVKPLADALDDYERQTGISIDIHVDGASGAMLAPFCAPNIDAWDFRLERVKSISTSGHKFGLSPVGVGWIIWRTKQDLPEGLVFHVNYLGGDMPTFALNFSRPAGKLSRNTTTSYA